MNEKTEEPEHKKQSMQLTEQARSEKKPRTKKKDNKHTPAPAEAAVEGRRRPSKKRLRKMKYQQEQLSPAEFLLVSAENARFTGSVWMEDGSSSARMTSLASADRIQVVTSSSFSTEKDQLNQSFGMTTEPSSSLIQIRVQPLLVLDLNGILCHRIRRYKEPPDAHYPASYRPSLGHVVANTPIIPRPNLETFLHFLDQNFCLALWTSAKRKTATALVRSLFPPEIASRLLFVWGQDRCRVVEVSSGNNKYNKNDDTQHGPHHHDTTIFEKDLAQVWNQFPLWNANNTILMDDSPDKCLSWKHNAIHPAPLNGRRIPGVVTTITDRNGGNTCQPFLSDDENDQLQRTFFHKLIAHWTESPLLQEWDLHDAGDSIFHVPKRYQVDFFREHAAEHMGWECRR